MERLGLDIPEGKIYAKEKKKEETRTKHIDWWERNIGICTHEGASILDKKIHAFSPFSSKHDI